MQSNHKKFFILLFGLSIVSLMGCSPSKKSIQTQFGRPVSNVSVGDEVVLEGQKDIYAGMTDQEKQFLEYFIQEGRERLQNIGEGRIAFEKGYERSDIVEQYQVYVRMTRHYSNDPTRIKMLVAVYDRSGLPVQSLEDLEGSGKRGNIMIDGVGYVPYLYSDFFFESEFKTEDMKAIDQIIIEFKYNGKITEHSVPSP